MAAFPTFSDGSTVHLPWTETVGFRNVIVRQRNGYQYGYNERAQPLRRFEATYMLATADRDTLLAFWEARCGAWEAFSFTHPDTAVTYPNCRFDGDELPMEGFEPGLWRVRVAIQEFAA